MRLRLYHHPDGARVAYREARRRAAARAAALGAALAQGVGAGRRARSPTASASCCPTCRCTATPRTARATPTRSTGSPRCSAGFVAEVLGPRPLIAGHDAGAEILLHAVRTRQRAPVAAGADAQPPARAARARAGLRAAWRIERARRRRARARRAALLRRRAPCSRPQRGAAPAARGNPAAADLVRHAFADVPGNSSLARSWAQVRAQLAARRAAPPARPLPAPADARAAAVGRPATRMHPLAAAEEALALLPARPAARAAEHRLPDGLRRSRRPRARAGGLLRVGSAPPSDLSSDKERQMPEKQLWGGETDQGRRELPDLGRDRADRRSSTGWRA